MKRLVIGFMALAALSGIATAKEGGNGGGAFVCRNSNGKIVSAELVDFYEGASEYKLSIKKSASEVQDQINKASVKYLSVIPSKAQDFLESVQNVQSIMNVIPNARLENTNDFNLRVSPKSCAGGSIQFEQLANYTDDNRLTVDEEIYNALSNTDKAGLVIHEAAYLLSRKWHDAISSREARRLTAYLFSNTPAQSISKDVLAMNLVDPNSNKKWVCSALVVGVEYDELEDLWNRPVDCGSAFCYVKKNVKKLNISVYGSDMFKAQENFHNKLRQTKVFPYQDTYKRNFAEHYCGADSSVNILEIISKSRWHSTDINTIIDCQRTWSPNFDCKKI